jgi:hypothetical protein
MPAPKLGVTVMPEWFACEGVDAVLDRVQSIGATAIATSPYVLEPAPEGEGGREPPIDAGAGRVRPLDRKLYGRHELWVRTAPSFRHDLLRYEGLAYQPSQPAALTSAQGDVLDRTIEAAASRGVEVLLQVMAASPPGYRVQFSSLRPEDECLGPDFQPVGGRVDRNGSFASDAVRAYTATLVAELAERYPRVAGFRLDWPEYPPYTFRSALFDFNAAVAATMSRHGREPHDVAREVRAWSQQLAGDLRRAAPAGAAALRKVFASDHWRALVGGSGPLLALSDAKAEAVRGLIAGVRSALDSVPGPRRRLELQAFPPPFPRISGFPLGELAGLADAVGIKLYTMHWPMIARFWARDLGGDASDRETDALTAALAEAFAFVDAPVDGATLAYPEPDAPHPAGERAQRDKILSAQAQAGRVPVIAFAHTYGPLDDVVARYRTAASAGLPVWLNRYGYLSDEKLAALAAERS